MIRVNKLIPRRLSFAPRSFIKYGIMYFLLFVLVLIMIVPFFPHLVVMDGQTNKTLYQTAMMPKETFVIRYIHSIHLTPVKEIYQISNDADIILQEVHFDTFSVGMPSELNEGEVLELKDGKIMIKNMNRQLPFIDLRIGQVIANHTLIINDTTVQLSKIAPPGSWVRIKATRLSMFELVKGGFMLEK